MSDTALPRTRLVLADLVPGARLRDVALVIGGAGLTGLAAQASIHTPLTPVPFTLQTLAVLLVGASLGTARATGSMALYLLAGGLGVPWFAGGEAGWTWGPSFGYLVAFLPMAALVGCLARRGADRRVLPTLALMALATAVVYLVGASWLAVSAHMSAGQAWRLGVEPFLIGDALKVAAATLVLPSAWALVRR
jgi:biotin transport system substrate-specific component